MAQTSLKNARKNGAGSAAESRSVEQGREQVCRTPLATPQGEWPLLPGVGSGDSGRGDFAADKKTLADLILYHCVIKHSATWFLIENIELPYFLNYELVHFCICNFLSVNTQVDL